MNVLKDGIKIEMTYEEICNDLGFCPNVHFVEITNFGTITFTVGKPNEIQALYQSVTGKGYKPAKKLTDLIRAGRI